VLSRHKIKRFGYSERPVERGVLFLLCLYDTHEREAVNTRWRIRRVRPTNVSTPFFFFVDDGKANYEREKNTLDEVIVF